MLFSLRRMRDNIVSIGPAGRLFLSKPKIAVKYLLGLRLVQSL